MIVKLYNIIVKRFWMIVEATRRSKSLIDRMSHVN
jgi:hypothetical protein